MSKSGRQAQLNRRLAVWEPLIGAEATITSTRGIVFNQIGYLLALLFVAVTVGTQVVHAPKFAYFLVPVPLFLISMAFLVQGMRFGMRASKQAAEVVATSPKAGVPTRSLESFQRWQKNSQFAKSTD